MAHPGRSNADDRLAFELATGKSLRDAAQLANVGAWTARRRWQDAEFRKPVSRLRTDFIAQASGQLANTTNEAVETLKQLLSVEHPPAVRLGAARSIIDLAFCSRELTDLEDRIQNLEDESQR